MILFYTGAVQADYPQPDSRKSLGGYVSNTIIPNNLVSNIFSPLSKTDIKNKKNQLRCIVLKNTFPTTVNSIKIWIETEEDSKCEILLGNETSMFIDNCGKPFAETIIQSDSFPYYITFGEHKTIDTAVEVSSLDSQGTIAIWLNRVPLEEEVIEVPNPLGKSPCELEYEELEAIQENTLEVDGFKLIIDWTS